MVRLNCFYQANEGQYDTALQAAKDLVAASLKQEGCIAYDVFESKTRDGIFMICETWADQAVLDAHSASAPFAQYVGIMQECGQLKVEVFVFEK